MSILYHLMIPRPQVPTHDAVVQEVEALRAHPHDDIVYLNPARKPGSRFPERLYGLHRLPDLRRRESSVQIHHVFNPHLRFFPYLRWLRRPIIYSITAGMHSSRRQEDPSLLKRLSAVVVTNQRDRDMLRDRGLEAVYIIRPGIDTARFHPTSPPDSSRFTLLAGSAPWTEAQFQTKGVEALLGAATAQPNLRLVFLWRGLLFEEMQQRVRRYGLENRVQVVNQRVDVNQVLAGVHAAVVLATDTRLVKAFPHSLLEALAAGRPVLVSRALPIADYVALTGCGQIVDSVSPEGVLKALTQLIASYDSCRAVALQVGHKDFQIDAFVKAYKRLYAEVESPLSRGA